MSARHYWVEFQPHRQNFFDKIGLVVLFCSSISVVMLTPQGSPCITTRCNGLLPVILLFVKIGLSIFSFDVWDKLWVLIRPVPEVALLI